MVWQSSFWDPIYFLFGRGLGTFPADSLYFTYLAEFGFPGLFLLGYLLWLLIHNGFRVFDSLTNVEFRAIAKGVLCFNIVMLIINISGTHLHNFPGDLYFWFWNGVLAKLGDAETQ
jgi:hypothetical protein